eukprot:m.412052 g.412052  ORF g.412052 m.412052 type:complete len:273 (+) comp20169_c1_seq5:755-1573(+)
MMPACCCSREPRLRMLKRSVCCVECSHTPAHARTLHNARHHTHNTTTRDCAPSAPRERREGKIKKATISDFCWQAAIATRRPPRAPPVIMALCRVRAAVLRLGLRHLQPTTATTAGRRRGCASLSVVASTARLQPLAQHWTRQPWVQLQACSLHRSATSSSDGTVRVVFQDSQGNEEECEADIGESVLDVAVNNDIDLEGACGGTLACSTCHVILEEKDFDEFDEPEEEELDMLDLAVDLHDTSRLGCQLILRTKHDGIVLRLPREHTDARG